MKSIEELYNDLVNHVLNSNWVNPKLIKSEEYPDTVFMIKMDDFKSIYKISEITISSIHKCKGEGIQVFCRRSINYQQ